MFCIFNVSIASSCVCLCKLQGLIRNEWPIFSLLWILDLPDVKWSLADKVKAVFFRTDLNDLI